MRKPLQSDPLLIASPEFRMDETSFLYGSTSYIIGCWKPLTPPEEAPGLRSEDSNEYSVPSGTSDGLLLSFPRLFKPVPYSEKETFGLLNAEVKLKESPLTVLEIVFSLFIIPLSLISRLSSS